MEISKCLLLFRLKYSWFGVKFWSASNSSVPGEWWLAVVAVLLLLPAPHHKDTHTHTHTPQSLFPKAMDGPRPGAGSPPKHRERSTGFRTYAYTALSYALVVLFMPVSRMLHLTQ